MKIKDKLNLANLFTTIRLVSGPVFIATFLSDMMLLSFIIMCAALITDIADGYFAKKAKKLTFFGKVYDSATDKTFFFCILIAFILAKILSITNALMIFTRDILVILFAIFAYLFTKNREEIKARCGSHWFSKLTTWMQAIVVIMLFFAMPYATYLIYVAFIFGIISAAIYFKNVVLKIKLK